VRLAHRKAARPGPLQSTHTFRHFLRSPAPRPTDSRRKCFLCWLRATFDIDAKTLSLPGHPVRGAGNACRLQQRIKSVHRPLTAEGRCGA
jgi:hypothetical protein